MVEDQMWSAKERTIIAKTKQYLEDKRNMKVEIEELEDLLGPDDMDVDFMRNFEEARDETGCEMFDIFSADGPSEFLVVNLSWWGQAPKELERTKADKIRPPLQVMDSGKSAWKSRESAGI